MTETVAGPAHASFLKAMASGVAVVSAVANHQKFAAALPSVASYSIDPPSVVLSLPNDLARIVSPVFGVSLLAANQQPLARALWKGPRETEDLLVRNGVPLVSGALAHLICKPTMTAHQTGRWIVVGEVTDVAVRAAQPLLWLDGDFSGDSA